jgi:hypothetical protein
MPTFEFTSPEGKSYEMTGPEGSTKEQAFEKFKEMRPELFSQKQTPSQTKSFLKSFAEGLPAAGGGLAGAELGAMAGAPLGPIGMIGGGLIGGIGGSIAGAYGGKKAMEQVPEDVKKEIGFSPEQRSIERQAFPKTSFAGEVAPDVATLGTSLVPKAYRAGETAVKAFRAPEPIADVKDMATLGEKGFDLLKRKASDLFNARRIEADTKYKEAFTAARQAQAKGQPFATSPQGKQLLSDLESEKRVIAGSESFEKGSAKIAGIDRLISAIKGKTTGGFERVAKETPAGKKIYGISGTPSKTTEKDIEAIVEELRFLRDVDAKGTPYEAYASLDAGYKRDLIKKLEQQLYDWAPEYRRADEAYKAASDKLSPFKTQLMSGALKGEKFDPTDLVKSPEMFGQTFFKDVNTVRNLKEATGSPGEVARLGKEYVASIFAGKSPKQVQEFVKDAYNTGWLKEAGIYDDVANYANKATTAESKQKILSNLGKGALWGVGVSTIGGPAYYGIRHLIGY